MRGWELPLTLQSGVPMEPDGLDSSSSEPEIPPITLGDSSSLAPESQPLPPGIEIIRADQVEPTLSSETESAAPPPDSDLDDAESTVIEPSVAAMLARSRMVENPRGLDRFRLNSRKKTDGSSVGLLELAPPASTNEMGVTEFDVANSPSPALAQKATRSKLTDIFSQLHPESQESRNGSSVPPDTPQPPSMPGKALSTSNLTSEPSVVLASSSSLQGIALKLQPSRSRSASAVSRSRSRSGSVVSAVMSLHHGNKEEEEGEVDPGLQPEEQVVEKAPKSGVLRTLFSELKDDADPELGVTGHYSYDMTYKDKGAPFPVLEERTFRSGVKGVKRHRGRGLAPAFLHGAISKRDLFTSLGKLEHDSEEEAEVYSTEPPAIVEPPSHRLGNLWRKLPAELRNTLSESLSGVWLFLILQGLFASILANFITLMVDGALLMRWASYDFFASLHLVLGWIWWMAWVFVLGMGAAAWTKFIGPHAVGSGLPEMKARLSGVYLRYFLSVRTFLGKVGGVILALGGGLVVGKEGPFVHMSSIMADKIHLCLPRIRKNFELRRQLLFVAVATGLSTSFRTPVGGVLFSIEVTASYYHIQNYWRSFVASVSGGLLTRLITSVVNQTWRPLISLYPAASQDQGFAWYELPVFVVFAMICGLLGALFVRCFALLYKSRTWLGQWKYKNLSIFIGPYRYAIIVCLLTGLLTFPGILGEGMGYSSGRVLQDLLGHEQLTDCEGGWTIWSLLVFAAVRFVLLLVSIQLPIPAGVFTPLMAIGGALGRFVGELFREFVMEFVGEEISVVPYVAIGAAAFSGSVTQAVSTAIILLEISGEQALLMPLLIGVIVSIAVSMLLSSSLYDTTIRLRGIPYLPPVRNTEELKLKAGDIMSSEAMIMSLDNTYVDAAEVFSATTTQRYFPLVRDDSSLQLVGCVDRNVLLDCIAQRELAFQHENSLLGDTIYGLELALDDVTANRNMYKISETLTLRRDLSETQKTHSDGLTITHKGLAQANADELLREASDNDLTTKSLKSRGSRKSLELDTIIRRKYHLSEHSEDESSSDSNTQTNQSAFAVSNRVIRKVLVRLKIILARRQAEFFEVAIPFLEEPKLTGTDLAPFEFAKDTTLYRLHMVVAVSGAPVIFVSERGSLSGIITHERLVKACMGRLQGDPEFEALKKQNPL